MYKNLLQETAHRAGLKLPVYTTVRSGPGHTPVFTCTVELAGMSFTGDPAKTKKQAEKNAAMAAWSALKQLPYLGPSSSTSSLSAHEGNEEQEQVIVARALANLNQPEGDKLPSQSERHHSRRRSAHICRDMPPTSTRCVYSMPYQSWAYPNFSSEAASYQMWQQAQASQQQANLLKPPANPLTVDLRIFPIPRSMYQPTQSQFLTSVEQDPDGSLPCSKGSTSSLPVHTSDYPASVPSRNLSQMTIKEIHEVQTQGEREEWLILPSDSAVYCPFTVSDASASIRPDDTDDLVNFEESLDDKEGKHSLGKIEVHLERRTNSPFQAVKSVTSSSRPSTLMDSDDGIIIQESQPKDGSESKLPEVQPGASIWHALLAPNFSLISKQNTNPFDPTRSAHRFHQPFSNFANLHREFKPPAVDAPVLTRLVTNLCPSGPRAGALRPQAPQLAAPGMLRTAPPACSARPAAVNLSIGLTLPSFMASPVRVRSIVPVCSAPARNPEIKQTSGHEKEAISGVSSEFGKLQI